MDQTSIEISSDIYDKALVLSKELDVEPKVFIENCILMYEMKEAIAFHTLIKRIRIITKKPLSILALNQLSILYTFLKTISHRLPH